MKVKFRILVWAVVFLVFASLVYLSGPFSASFSGCFRTFFYDCRFISDTLFSIGGFSRLSADFVSQFFVTPIIGVLVSSFVLTLIAIILNRILRKLSGSDFTLPAALFLPIILGILGLNVNYLYSGTISILFILIFIDIFFSVNTVGGQKLYSIITSVLLFFLTGPASVLYAVTLFVIALFRSPRKLWIFIYPLILVPAIAIISIRAGWAGDISHLLTPAGYFNPKLEGGSFNWLPWSVTLIAIFIAGLWSVLRPHAIWFRIILSSILLLLSVSFCIFRAPRYIDRELETVKELSYKASENDWDGIFEKCCFINMNNLLRQNFLNIALAEKQILADRLFTFPCYDIQSIYVQGEKNPYVYTLLSDIYWSMGHIAFSQRYAFEANESLGNYSPRLLKRLVQTNEALGYTEVAAKYRRLLSKTLFYKEWAENYDTPEVKKNCVFPDNRLCGINGLDDDLKQIILTNPEHLQTIQYLGSLCLLLRDPERFMKVMDTFYGTDALPEILPTAFQEGIVYCAAGDAATLEKYHIQKETLERFEQYKSDHRTQSKTFWYFIIDKK